MKKLLAVLLIVVCLSAPASALADRQVSSYTIDPFVFDLPAGWQCDSNQPGIYFFSENGLLGGGGFYMAQSLHYDGVEFTPDILGDVVDIMADKLGLDPESNTAALIGNGEIGRVIGAHAENSISGKTDYISCLIYPHGPDVLLVRGSLLDDSPAGNDLAVLNFARFIHCVDDPDLQ